MTKRALLFSLAGSLLIYACGGSVSDNPQPTDDGGADAAVDPDAAVDAGPVKYPADHAPLPQVDYHGGRILDAM